MDFPISPKRGAMSEIEAQEMREKAKREIDSNPLYMQLQEKYESTLKALKSKPYSFREYSEERIKKQGETRSFEEQMGNAAMGLPGEVGEVVEHIKKWFYHGKELDRDYLKKELGDVLWYINFMSNALGFTLEDVAKENNRKLNKRYPNGFSVEEASKVNDGFQRLEDVPVEELLRGE